MTFKTSKHKVPVGWDGIFCALALLLLQTTSADGSTYTANPTNGTTSGGLNTGRDIQTATLLANGLVLVARGARPLSSAEPYSPAIGTWTPISPLNTAGDFSTATMLPDGLVLVAGGFLLQQ